MKAAGAEGRPGSGGAGRGRLLLVTQAVTRSAMAGEVLVRGEQDAKSQLVVLRFDDMDETRLSRSQQL